MADLETHTDSPARMPPVLVGLALAAMVLVFALLLFVPAGRLDWAFGWIFVGIVATNVTISWACLLRWNPELIEHRMRFGKGTKVWDKVWGVLFAPVMIAVYIVAELEARDGVSSLPGTAWLLGLAIFVLGSTMPLTRLTNSQQATTLDRANVKRFSVGLRQH